MFEGNGFGVGLTINQLREPSPRAEVVPAGVDRHPTRLGELMPVATRDDVGLGEEMRRVNIADSRLWAYRLEMSPQLAARRRDDRDRASGQAGCGGARLGADELGAGGLSRSSCPTRSR